VKPASQSVLSIAIRFPLLPFERSRSASYRLPVPEARPEPSCTRFEPSACWLTFWYTSIASILASNGRVAMRRSSLPATGIIAATRSPCFERSAGRGRSESP
jgi:hypothetical protein